MNRPAMIRFGLKSIQTLFSHSDKADPRPTYNRVLAKWKDRYDRYGGNSFRGRQTDTLSYLVWAD